MFNIKADEKNISKKKCVSQDFKNMKNGTYNSKNKQIFQIIPSYIMLSILLLSLIEIFDKILHMKEKLRLKIDI